jgi:hypothetical protein
MPYSLSRIFMNASISLVLVLFAGSTCLAQTGVAARDVYEKVKAFDLDGGGFEVSNLIIKRDRVVMTFTGTFQLSAPINGKMTGAVFIGTGNLQADPPANEFEKANLKRLTKKETISSDFSTAVFRFTDDTGSILSKETRSGTASPQTVKLAAEINSRTLRETGANIAARIAVSLINQEDPGFFFATFDGGKSDRFSFVMDHQNRVPTSYFDINGGEKGLIYSYNSLILSTEPLLAFYSESDYARSSVDYSDSHDLIDIEHYSLEVDLRSPKNKLGLRSKIKAKSLANGVAAIPFVLGESLNEYQNARLKRQMRVKTVRMGQNEVPFVQEDWEGGLTVFLPKAARSAESIELEMDLEGNFLRDGENIRNCSYPISNTTWYPRHGYLDRSTYDLKFLHSKNLKVAAIGLRTSETEWPEDKNVTSTEYKMTQPVALATFALGPWQRHAETVKFEGTERSIPLEFNSVMGEVLAIKESFILAELDNSIRYFNALFGAYPYDSYSATFHPFAFGQGFPTMLMIPPADRASKHTFAFISHEAAHQWWGNIVSWRSYRDQWLSEGFAEYSGALYTERRDSKGAGRSLFDEMRTSLKDPPRTLTGMGSGKLNDVGPIILGHRLNSSKTLGAYQALIYNKGALVLRMLHFLLSDPISGDDKAFFAMMKDFVEKYRNQAASTDDFRIVASAYFAKSPIGKKYGLSDLNWFFRQWVYTSEMPSYRFEYSIQSNPDGSAQLVGTVTQSDVSDRFFMPVPVRLTFAGNRIATGTIAAHGPSTPINIKLPMKPEKIEIDPEKWILADKISVK